MIKTIKSVGLLSIILMCMNSCSANEIDSLKTDKEVFAFVRQFFKDFKSDGSFNEYYNETIKVADSLNVSNWVKADIDNNCETDLCVFRADDLPKVFAVLSFNGKFKVVKADYWCKYQFIYPIVTSVMNQNVILLYNQNQDGYDDKIKHFIYTKLDCDTLMVKDSLFLNYIPFPRHYNIEKIEINNNGMCEGNCPRINITINPKTFESNCSRLLYWDSQPKSATGQLTQEQIKNILSLLDNSNFGNLKNSYGVNCTDQTTTTLTITFDGGETKKIEDYGSSGNFTLTEIYNIAYNIDWNETK
jgi:hypothetical protein